MTLDEAIKHLDEELKNDKHDWDCEECKMEHKQLRDWLIELDGLRVYAACKKWWSAEDKAIRSNNTPTPDKKDLKITFIGGGEIVIPDEQWDDYRYDGKFFTIVKDGTDIAMYNAEQVFSLVMVRESD